ncbi:hypothetical protein GQ600_21470 [Phytophthora cactorum]|nr:hypothetical protein GQ600_21470 [Phytophthora cactorum]
MESRLVSLLLVVLIVALPVDIRRKCLQHSRINWMERSQLLVDEEVLQMSYASFIALAVKLEPFLPVDEKQSRNGTGKLRVCERGL